MNLFRITPANRTFKIVTRILGDGQKEDVLTYQGHPLTPQEKMRLKHEALTLRTTLLFKLLCSKVQEDMKKEIVENCKDLESINYYRAVLADRIIMEQEINTWADSIQQPLKEIPTPTKTPESMLAEQGMV